MKVSASFLASKKVIKTVKKLSFTDTDYIHVDFIDGTLVDGREISFRKIKQINKITSKRLDIHLMTSKLKKYIKKFASLNAEYITFHIEIQKNIEKYIELIHSYGVKVGIAINPDTDVELLEPYLHMIDMVLVMGVMPGYGGQTFIPDVVAKIEEIKKYLIQNQLKVIVSVDGGINDKTLPFVEDKVDMVVAGSYITNGESYQEKITSLR